MVTPLDPEDDKVLATAARTTAGALNAALVAAFTAGLRIEAEVDWREAWGRPDSLPIINVRVSRPL